MSDVKFEPLRKCPGLDGKGCSTLFDGSRGELCTACADQAPWLNPNHRRSTRQNQTSRRPIPVSEQAVASRDGSNPRGGPVSSGARVASGSANSPAPPK